MAKFAKVVRTAGLVLVIVALLVSVAGYWFVRRPWPETEGTLSVSGLQSSVQVMRDKWGVPHIYAQNDHDLFFTQGYVHAQDRLWQMEFNRRVSAGRLSEVAGPPTQDADRLLRALGPRRAAQREWELLDTETRVVLEDYAAGVNAYIDTHRDRLPLEFTILGVNPEPWTPIDTLAWGKYMSFHLSGNYRLELLRARLIAQLGEGFTREVLAPYGADKPIIVPPEARGYAGMAFASYDRIDAMDEILGDPTQVWGSNNWVVSGSRTASGRPMLANDTHLGLGIPSIWYENGLHGGNYDVIGFTFPGVPAVVIGHNQRIAWGVSNLNPDVADFYIEKLNDQQNPTQYEFKGQWEDLQILDETITVKNRAPIPLKVMITRHGPIMNQVMGDLLKDADPMALRWTGLEDASLLKAIRLMNRASNWEEFRMALSEWDLPSQNFVYADVDGNIGYQMPGKIPIRAPNHQGIVPMPGWTGEYEWQGYIPYEELPHYLNPPAGFIATANNKVIADDYPYLLAYDWDAGFRAKRITDLLAANEHVDMAAMQAIQGDTYSLPAETLAPYVAAIQPETELEARAIEYVKAWDRRYEVDRVGAAIYATWYWQLMRNTLRDDMGADLGDRYILGQYERHGTFQAPFFFKIMADPNSAWFDDKATPELETRDDIVHRSLVDALAWLAKRHGNDPAGWTWGKLHTISFAHAPLGQSRIRPLELIFNSPTRPARGDSFTVNAAGFGYSNPFLMGHGSSQRQIVDFSDLNNSVMIQTTGQSGHAFHPHYQDFVAMWQNVEYHPMLFSREKVAADAVDTLTLMP